MKKQKILTIGSLTVDIFAELPNNLCTGKSIKIPLGDKIRLQDGLISTGGGAANLAVGLAKMRFGVEVYGAIGDGTNSDFLLQDLHNKNVATNFIIKNTHQLASFSVILNSEKGERTVLHSHVSQDNFSQENLPNLSSFTGIFVSHLYPESSNIINSLARKKADNNFLIGWNPGKTQFDQGFESFKDVFPQIDLLILNQEEAEFFTKLKAKSSQNLSSEIGENIDKSTIDLKINDVRNLAGKFLQAGVKCLIITDGGRGAQLFTKTEHYYANGEIANKVSTLGAGDAFAVGAFGATLLGKNPAEKLNWGTKNAINVIQSFGAQNGQMSLKELAA